MDFDEAAKSAVGKQKFLLTVKRNVSFSFADKPLEKSQSYQHEAESTLKNNFCKTCGAQDTKIRRFPRES